MFFAIVRLDRLGVADRVGLPMSLPQSPQRFSPDFLRELSGLCGEGNLGPCFYPLLTGFIPERAWVKVVESETKVLYGCVKYFR
jgi:hypothetical protein